MRILFFRVSAKLSAHYLYVARETGAICSGQTFLLRDPNAIAVMIDHRQRLVPSGVQLAPRLDQDRICSTTFLTCASHHDRHRRTRTCIRLADVVMRQSQSFDLCGC